MADDRPLELPEDAIGRIDGKLADLESTLLARINRKPVGDIEIAFRGTPKPGTIFLQGQTLQRAEYPDLWDWAQASGSVVAGGYGAGDGTTTFTLPDMRGRFLVGADGTVALGGTGGSATRTLTIANLPAHGHGLGGGTVASASHTHASDALHSHSIGGAGAHGGHNSGSFPVAGGSGATVAAFTQDPGGGHDHGGGTGGAGAHNHGPSSHGHDLSGTTDNAGSGTAFDNRPPFLGVNVAVWA